MKAKAEELLVQWSEGMGWCIWLRPHLEEYPPPMGTQTFPHKPRTRTNFREKGTGQEDLGIYISGERPSTVNLVHVAAI